MRADLECDAQDLEAESWSLAIDQQFVKRHSKEAMKRQDVIYGSCICMDALCLTLPFKPNKTYYY